LKIERIISQGQASAPGFWYDQTWNEWVIVLQGSAALRFEDEGAGRTLGTGDYVFIPARQRHRVEWSDPRQPTVWLAVHFE
jgi:cupin 2 domain-containing protein